MKHVEGGEQPEVLDRFHAELGLVDEIARQLARSLRARLDFDELRGAGREGLWDAALRYDAECDVPFRMFAICRVRGAMLDHLRRMAPIPRRAYQRLVVMEAAHLVSEGQAERSPSESTLSGDVAEEAIREHLLAMLTAEAMRLVSVGSLADMEDGILDPEEAYEREELAADIRAEVEHLAPEQATVIRRYYFDEHGLGRIAADMNVSKSWVSRLHTRAITLLSFRLRARKIG